MSIEAGSNDKESSLDNENEKKEVTFRTDAVITD